MISESAKYILPPKSSVAYQGEIGAYSELAILNHIENGITIPKNSFQEIFEALSNGSVSYGMVPVSNSIAGKVEGIEELYANYNPQIIHELHIVIEHCLIVNPGITEIKSVYSHIQALKQCQKYISENMLFQIPYYDTAGAVKMIKELGLLDAGAIASKLAADVYGMDILDSNLGTKDNVTTFSLVKLRE